MDNRSISHIAKRFDISTRTLRYYEQLGLISPQRDRYTAYRSYTVETVSRIQQIIVLRKLRIPLKQIAGILENADAAAAVDAFRQSLSEIEDEIAALSTIRNITRTLLLRLNRQEDILRLMDDASLLKTVDSLKSTKLNFKEGNTMSDLSYADKKLSKLQDVRILYLPPMTIAAASATGENCEGKASDIIHRFVLENDLLNKKPDIRSFGFDCSAGKAGIGQSSYKYQVWISIPDDIAVPKPLVRRVFSGGLYAAHMIKGGDFDHWALLHAWVEHSEKYQTDWCSVRCHPIEPDMERCLEEILNYRGTVQTPAGGLQDMQFDLLFPVKEK